MREDRRARPEAARLDALLERRCALGQDRYDEVWAGDYHMVPVPHAVHGYIVNQVGARLHPLAQQAGLTSTSAFNLGRPDDYRVPDGGLHRGRPTTLFVPTAAVVIEVVAPDDETWDKIDFYNACSVDELLIADPARRSVTWLRREDGQYAERDSNALLGVSSAVLGAEIEW